MNMPAPHQLENRIILLLGTVQFLNILDFMMVMPLGPDFAHALGIPNSHLGWIGGSYTAAASVMGLLAAFFLDRFERKLVLQVALLGLTLSTLACALAVDFTTLVMARISAGLFGGPASAVALAIVGDIIPAQRRGAAMGKIMAAFSLASIFGVPFGLELARLYGWHAPFFAVSSLGILVMLAVAILLPRMRMHLDRIEGPVPAGLVFRTLGQPVRWMTLLYLGLGMAGNFMIVPNIAAYLQFNIGYPRDSLGMLYLFGGIASFIVIRFGGKLADRWNVFHYSLCVSLFISIVIYLGFINYPLWLPIPVIFTCYMAGSGLRNVVGGTLATKVPAPIERAGFMSLQNAVQHLSMAIGAFLSSLILLPRPDGGLDHVVWISTAAIMLMLIVPFLQRAVEKRLTPQ